jgi:hypothetical protein
MTSTIIANVQQYALTLRPVPSVDNQGEPCEVCQLEGNTVSCNVYGVVVGPYASLYQMVECCDDCCPDVITTMDPTADVTVEYVADAVDDRMHGPDCVCVHPDAQ